MNAPRLFVTLSVVFVVGACTFAACTPKREAATVNQIRKKADCALSNLNRSPEQMLIDCLIPKDSEDVMDIIDIFVGAQAGAMQAGAKLPNSGPQAGMKLNAHDAGR